jgi:1,4-dihydroxy-2-naphthoyl-CoA hydrolase
LGKGASVGRMSEANTLPELLGLEWLETRHGYVRGRMDVKRAHMAPNGYMHAASVIALADSACGFGAMLSRPEGATGFTTIELKSNFLGTVREGGAIGYEGKLVHGGRATQVWDAEVKDEANGKTIALFPLHANAALPQVNSFPSPSRRRKSTQAERASAGASA